MVFKSGKAMELSREDWEGEKRTTCTWIYSCFTSRVIKAATRRITTSFCTRGICRWGHGSICGDSSWSEGAQWEEISALGRLAKFRVVWKHELILKALSPAEKQELGQLSKVLKMYVQPETLADKRRMLYLWYVKLQVQLDLGDFNEAKL